MIDNISKSDSISESLFVSYSTEYAPGLMPYSALNAR